MLHLVHKVNIEIPELCLLILIGPSGSGKSSFARRHFDSAEVVSFDDCRSLINDDQDDGDADEKAIARMRELVSRRLGLGRLAVVDAPNVNREARRPLVNLAQQHHVPAVALVFDLPESACHEHNRERSMRKAGRRVVRHQHLTMRQGLMHLVGEGFDRIVRFESAQDVMALSIRRRALANDHRHERGPFDIIGDVHGCFDELLALLDKLGYEVADAPLRDDGLGYNVSPPARRKVVFVGDLVDRGPRVPDCLRLVMAMVADGIALCLPGNHDMKLARALRGHDVKIPRGLRMSLEQLEPEGDGFRERVAAFFEALPSHCMLDGGRLVVAHAGLKAEMHGRESRAVRDFCLYGDTTGEKDEHGFPVRRDWGAAYQSEAAVVYGHTPLPAAEWVNNTINIDTGCVFGGKLTALRYPECDLVCVAAQRAYAKMPPALRGKGLDDGTLELH